MSRLIPNDEGMTVSFRSEMLVSPLIVLGLVDSYRFITLLEWPLVIGQFHSMVAVISDLAYTDVSGLREGF